MRRNITWSHRITKSRRKGIFRAFFFTALNPGEFSKNPLQSGSCPLELAHPMLVITLERCSEQKESAGHLELHQPLAGGTPSTAVRVKPISRDCGKEGSQETKHAEASCTRAETLGNSTNKMRRKPISCTNACVCIEYIHAYV